MSYRFRKPELVPTIAVIISTVLMFWLGIWQLQRLERKTKMLADIDIAQSEPPRDLLSYPAAELAGHEWHNVIATGTLLNDKELYATPRYLKEHMGYAVLTPLAVAMPGGTQYVLVNRGWVDDVTKDPAKRAAGNPAGTVKVEGVLRNYMERGWLWRKFFHNAPDKNLWLWYDRPAMEERDGLKLLPVYIDATRITLADGTALKDGPTPFPIEINIRNDHLGYAITWFLIGISGIVIYVLYHREEKREA